MLFRSPASAHDSQGRLLAGAAVGITANVMDRVQALVDASVDCIVIDSAHGHSKNIITTLKNIKSAFPDLQVIAGNIATGAAAKALCEAAGNGTGSKGGRCWQEDRRDNRQCVGLFTGQCRGCSRTVF